MTRGEGREGKLRLASLKARFKRAETIRTTRIMEGSACANGNGNRKNGRPGYDATKVRFASETLLSGWIVG